MYLARISLQDIFNGLLAKYSQSTTGFFRGLESGIDLLDQEEGLGPGAVETSWLYDLTVKPLVAEVQNIVSKEGGIISTIVDDFSIVSSFDSMIEALKVLVKKGKEVGYFINFDKTQYCMSPVYNKHILQTRVKISLDMGFSIDMIKIHPDSVSLSDEPVDERRDKKNMASNS